MLSLYPKHFVLKLSLSLSLCKLVLHSSILSHYKIGTSYVVSETIVKESKLSFGYLMLYIVNVLDCHPVLHFDKIIESFAAGNFERWKKLRIFQDRMKRIMS